MAFDRWKPTLGKTLAFRSFTHHHTEINNHYWSHRLALKNVFAQTRALNQDAPATQLYGPGLNGGRYSYDLKTWGAYYGGFDNWVRLSSLVAICGYLEIYMRRMVDLACQSCPALLVGRGKDLEGVWSLRDQKKYEFTYQADLCCKGVWSKRLSNYARLFGGCPATITHLLSDLEKLRKARNQVGHAFGRPLRGHTSGDSFVAGKPMRISEERLKASLDLADTVAKTIEKDLGPRFIGCYETFVIFHKWPNKGNFTVKLTLDQFRAYFDSETETSGTLSRHYSKRVIDIYYNNPRPVP